MRLQIFSDFHFDVSVCSEPRLAGGVDVAIVAGDVCEGIARGCAWLRRHIPRPTPIVLVAGNHEFYHRHRGSERTGGPQAARAHDVHLLDDTTVEVGHVRFVGATLWTDFDVFGARNRDAAMQVAQRGLHDHLLIAEGDDDVFTPAHARRQHIASRGFLERVLATPHAGPTVVVTHHAPHPRSIARQFADDPLTPAFVSDLSLLIERARPALWVHGHTHASFDYRVGPDGATRIVCNPHGYGAENPHFDPALVVEV